MKFFKSHFQFNKQERSGIFFLLLFIVLLQACYFFFSMNPFSKTSDLFAVDEDFQAKIDILKKRQLENDTIKIYPFNPNFITDYKGYALGMSVDEIDRLIMYRSTNKYVNSAIEFQKITKVSDSLLQIISPYFKFPEWTRRKNKSNTIHSNQNKTKQSQAIEKLEIKDLNKITAEELKIISGIGDKLSARIIKFRDKLGGFLIDDQLYDVYGLEADVVKKTLLKYKVRTKPHIQKININTASAYEMSRILYINHHIAEKIVDYRQNIGFIKSFDELKEIDGFPSDKINRIELYLYIKLLQ